MGEMRLSHLFSYMSCPFAGFARGLRVPNFSMEDALNLDNIELYYCFFFNLGG